MSILAQGFCRNKEECFKHPVSNDRGPISEWRWSCDPLDQDIINLIKLCAVSSDRQTLYPSTRTWEKDGQIQATPRRHHPMGPSYPSLQLETPRAPRMTHKA